MATQYDLLNLKFTEVLNLVKEGWSFDVACAKANLNLKFANLKACKQKDLREAKILSLKIPSRLNKFIDRCKKEDPHFKML